MIAAGRRVAPVEVEGWWKDTGKAEDILDANRLLLTRRHRDIRGEVEASDLVGDMVIEPGAVVRRSTVFGPALVCSGSRVEDAYIGPFTTLGERVVLERAEIEYAVVGADTAIRDVGARIQGSLIGEDVTIAGVSSRPSTHRLVVGDHSRIELQQ